MPEKTPETYVNNYSTKKFKTSKLNMEEWNFTAIYLQDKRNSIDSLKWSPHNLIDKDFKINY